MHDSLLNITQTDTLVTRNVLPVECADSVFVGSVRVLAERVDMSLSALDALMLSPVTQAVMLVVVLAYLLILCRRYGEAVEMSSWLIFPSLTPICESHSDWRFGLPWRVLGLFSMGVVATMLFYRVWDVSLALHPALVLGVVAIMVVLAWSLQWLVLKIVAEAVLQQRFVAMHHPFTSPLPEDMDKIESDPANCRANAYDIVLNGYEVGGGSIRIHDNKLQQTMFKALGFTEESAQERFGFLLDAFKYGAPPHGGLAYGLDRLAMLICGTDNIKDVIAFPKVQNASCLMSQAPDFVEPQQLKDLDIEITPVEKDLTQDE